MRKAKSNDYWRGVRSNKANLKIKSVNFADHPRIGTGEVLFDSSISVVCGKNGLGKTTLLKSILCVLDHSYSHIYPEICSSIHRSFFEVTLLDDGTEIKVGLNDKASYNAIDIDSTSFCQRSASFLTSEANLDELLDQYEYSVLDGHLIEEVGRILGREYSKIEFLEIDEVYDGEQMFPYFRASYGGCTYESPQMAMGELSVLYIVWLLSQIESPTIVLIDELENYLTPQAQRHLNDLLAFFAVSKKLWILLSTHSEHVVESVGIKNSIVLVEDYSRHTASFRYPLHNLEYLEHLGLSPKKKGVILVEDLVAEVVLREACNQLGSFVAFDYEIIIADGVPPIVNITKNFPVGARSVDVVGLLDGDQRLAHGNTDKRLCFLPGTGSPEQRFRGLALSSGQAVARTLGISEARFSSVMSSVGGSELHDWLQNLAEAISMDLRQCARDLAKVWVASDETEFRELLMDIDNSQVLKGQCSDIQESRSLGTLCMLAPGNNYGFISMQNGDRLFFPMSNVAVEDREQLVPGSKLSFNIEPSQQECNVAVDVVIEAGD